MNFKVIIPHHIITVPYFWYIYRSLYKLSQENKIELIINNNPPPADWQRYAASIYIDGKPIVIDLCDSSNFAIWELEKHPLGTILLKANYSQELWNNPPTSFEHKLPEDQKKYLSFIKPFVFGRALSCNFDWNEKEHYAKYISPISKIIVSLSGEGKFAQQTENRLKIYDFISKWVPNVELLWNPREHFEEENKIVNYTQRIQPYAKPDKSIFGSYENYIKWLSTGKYSLNTPGISASQPFRLVDAIFAQRSTISTKIWIDSCKECPTTSIPMEGYFNNISEDPETAKNILTSLNTHSYSLNEAEQWYDNYLSVNGMFKQLMKGVS